MKTFEKITSGLILTGIFLLSFSGTVFAQSALDDIKAKLESEGISVVDYSTPEGQWGSLPNEWISFLTEKKYTGLGSGSNSVASVLESDFIGNENSLTALRRLLAQAEADKSHMTDRNELDEQDLLIGSLKEDVRNQENLTKDDISDMLGDTGSLNKGEGINLIFHEVDFYFNYAKWGDLPTRIVNILESQTSGQEPLYRDLQAIIDIHGLDGIESAMSQIEGLSADDAGLIADSARILYASGESQIHLIASSIVNVIKNLLIGLAVLWIIYAGLRMVFAQGDENVITEQKRSLIYAGIGLVAILLLDRGVDYLYGPAGTVRTELIKDEGFSNEVYGLVHFIEALIGTLAILFIVISGVRILFAGGDEETIKKQKTSLLWIGVGLILIAIDQLLIEQIFIIPTQQQSDQIRTSNVVSIINTIGSVFQFILGFVGLIAFAALIYGAATMVLNYGNDEMVEKSKKIIRNAIIGIIVVLSAYVIVATLVVFR